MVSKMAKQEETSLNLTIKRLSSEIGLVWPKIFVKACSELKEGEENLKIIASKYGFKSTDIYNIIILIKFLFNKNLKENHEPILFIYRILHHLDPSYSTLPPPQLMQGNEALPSSETLQMKAVKYVEAGLKLHYVAKLLNVPYSTLHGQLKYSSGRKNHVVKDIVGQSSKAEDLGDSEEEECMFCHRPPGNEVEWGTFQTVDGIKVHYFCLLFSSALEQNGDDEEGILGFLINDVNKELRRGAKVKCAYCKKPGANVGCNNRHCRQTYHYTCGLEHQVQYVFTGNYKTLCKNHRNYQKGMNKGEEVECPICLQTFVATPPEAVVTTCCDKSTWFHNLCMKKLALNAGLFFKCPMCNDKNKFIPEMLKQGIYVPHQDASWELEPNAFGELLERPMSCESSKCRCPSGRDTDKVGTRWEILLCYSCGSTGIHLFCGKLPLSCEEWQCETCLAVVLKETPSSKNRKRKPASPYADEEKKSKKSRTGPLSDSDNVVVIESTDESSHVDVCFEKAQCSKSMLFSNASIRDYQRINQPVPSIFVELQKYAFSLPSILAKFKFDEMTFLHSLNVCTRNLSDSDAYRVDINCYRQFVSGQLSFHQMKHLRGVFDAFFTLHPMKMSQLFKNAKQQKRNPFTKTVGKVRSKLKVARQHLMTLLKFAKTSSLFERRCQSVLESDRTSTPSVQNVDLYKALPSSSKEKSTVSLEKSPDDESASKPIRLLQVIEFSELQENCGGCNVQLLPGYHPFTVSLATRRVEIICLCCFTCNAFTDVFANANISIDPSNESCEAADS